MKKNLLLFGGLYISVFGFSQTLLYNDNQTLFINDQAVMIVKNGDVDNNTGTIENKGNLIVEGSYKNQDQTIGGGLNSKFQIEKNWVNDANFTANQSSVILNGNLQLITGTQVSEFYNLYLENIGVKTQTIDASVSNVLKLNSVQLATGFNKMKVLNTDPNAIEFVPFAGFVSSQGDGRLVRNTNQNAAYLFPVGEINSGLKFRPITIEPKSTNANQFEVRMVYADAGTEGFPLSNQNGSLGNMNQNFFHFVNQSESTEVADLSIAYLPADDGNWNTIGNWKENEWTNIGTVATASNSNFSILKKENWAFANDEPHILANAKEGPLYAIPNAFAPNGAQDINKEFGVLNQNGMVSLEQMQIYDRWGTKVFDSNEAQKETWNGMYDNVLQPTGAYTYLINLKDQNDEAIAPISGNVLLIW